VKVPPLAPVRENVPPSDTLADAAPALMESEERPISALVVIVSVLPPLSLMVMTTFFSPALVYGGGMKLVAQFSENVSASQNDLTLVNRNTGATVSAGIAFSYDPATFTATWSLPASLAEAHYRATLLAAGLTDGSNNPLDGDYSGAAGGNQVYDFSHLGGDVTGDGRVDNADFTALYSNFGQSGKGWSGGDLNLDGVTDFIDFQILEQSFGKALAAPPASAEAPAVAAAPVVPAPTTRPPTSKPAAKPTPAQRATAPVAAPRFATQRIKATARRVNELLV